MTVDKFIKTFKLFKKNYKPIPLEVFGKNPYKTLISVLLSSRTLDKTTHSAAKRLFAKAPNIKKLSQLTEPEIRNLIYPVGFYRTKAKQLTKLAQIVLSEYAGKIPSTQPKLVRLPGVGKKTANLVLNRAFRIPAIAVDTHVHRISNLLGWVRTKTPEETQEGLEKVLPKKYWSEVNRLFVSIGQQYRGKARLLEFLKKLK